MQYNDWHGTVAADGSDFEMIEDLLGVDHDKWSVVMIEIAIYGGTQEIIAWGVAREDLPAYMKPTLNVTKLLHSEEEPAVDRGSNPAEPVVKPITWATELMGSGFKRLVIRMQKLGVLFDGASLTQVASLVRE